MNIIEALAEAKAGKKVRPVFWINHNRNHWVQAVTFNGQTYFVEHGSREEMPHALRMEMEQEYLGEWEVVE